METVTQTGSPYLPALVHPTGSPIAGSFAFVDRVSLFTALTVLELAMEARLATNSERNLPLLPKCWD